MSINPFPAPPRDAGHDNAAPAAGSSRVSARHIEDHVLRSGSNCVGDFERLAGVNTESREERCALWGRFQKLYAAPGTACMDAVMNECKRIAARRVNAGELCLWHPHFPQKAAPA